LVPIELVGDMVTSFVLVLSLTESNNAVAAQLLSPEEKRMVLMTTTVPTTSIRDTNSNSKG
jgi:hypothetical protein